MIKTLVNTEMIKIVQYGKVDEPYFVLFLKDAEGHIQGYNKYHTYDDAYEAAIKFIVYGKQF